MNTKPVKLEPSPWKALAQTLLATANPPATEASPDTPKVCPTNNVPSTWTALVAILTAVLVPSPVWTFVSVPDMPVLPEVLTCKF